MSGKVPTGHQCKQNKSNRRYDAAAIAHKSNIFYYLYLNHRTLYLDLSYAFSKLSINDVIVIVIYFRFVYMCYTYVILVVYVYFLCVFTDFFLWIKTSVWGLINEQYVFFFIANKFDKKGVIFSLNQVSERNILYLPRELR